MSDGSLSQEEIDALLMGDAPGEMEIASPPPSGNLTENEKAAMLNLLGEVTESQSATLSGIMVKTVTVGSPILDILGREELFSDLPDEVIEITLNYQEELSGKHLHILTLDDALKIAGPMMGQDDLEIDDTAISAVTEAMSQISGSAATTIGEKIGRALRTEQPQGQKVPKATMELPPDPFCRLVYDLQIEGQGSLRLIEIFELGIIREILNALNASSPEAAGEALAAAPPPEPAPAPEGGDSVNMGNLFSDPPPPQVQGVQLSELSQGLGAGEQQNIGLLMDVSMELTVELGRTKWKIKEILGMGEGTIIELDKLAGEPVDILVNNNLIARGEVVVIDENFGVRVTEIVSSLDRLNER